MKLTVISWDIGIRNLAYSVIEYNEGHVKIKALENVDLGCRKNETQKIIDRTIDILDEFMEDIDTENPIIILIESQLTAAMKSIQTCINVYFKLQAKYLSADIKTKYYNAKNKLSLIENYRDKYVQPTVTCSNQYKQNKKDSIDFGIWLLNNIYKDDVILEKLQKCTKRDDMIDTFLMGIHYIEQNKIVNK